MLNNQLRIISYLVIFYMLLAFSWWTVLLHTKNRDAFLAKNELLKLSLIAKNEIKNEEEAAKQSSNFLLSITHELKSPIASIRLGFETLQRKKLSEEQSLVLLKNGINDTDRLNNLVSDLLLSARLESTYQLNTELFSLEILIEECIQLLKQKFPSAIIKVNLIQEIPEILADYSAIRSVIINLLENAVKYSDSVPEINIGLTSTNERCNIEVSDKGIGIDQSERKKIFEKFYRVGNEDQRKTKGTGLGLYIVDQIVRAHNGTITVSSNQPKGTIFNIFLPFN